jgi:tetratricopeptide (TPR) repeat protein
MRAHKEERRMMAGRVMRTLTLGCALAVTASVASAQVPASVSRGTPMLSSSPDLLTSRTPDLLMSEGHDHYDAGRYKEAAASFERAMQLGVARPHEAARSVARSYAKLGNRKQAMRWLEIAELLEHPERAIRPLRSSLLLKI